MNHFRNALIFSFCMLPASFVFSSEAAKKQNLSSLFWQFIENARIRSAEQGKLVRESWGLNIQPKEPQLPKDKKE